MENTRHDVVDGPLTLREGVKGLRADDVPVSKEIWGLLRIIGDKLIYLGVPTMDRMQDEIKPNGDYRAYAVDSEDEIPTVKESADYARRMQEIQNLMFDAIITELNKHPELRWSGEHSLTCGFSFDSGSFGGVGLTWLEDSPYSFLYKNTPASAGRFESDNPEMTDREDWMRQIFDGIAQRLETAVIVLLNVEGRMNYSVTRTLTRSVFKSEDINWGSNMNRQFNISFSKAPERRIKVFFEIQPLPTMKPDTQYGIGRLGSTKAEWK